MPGRGRSNERPYSAEERSSIQEGATGLGVGDLDSIEILGDLTMDIFLNEAAFWKNVPTRVWNYTIGGYQVLKKWLSYRESTMLGRPLSEAEVRDFTAIARRIAAILLLGPALRASYEVSKIGAYSWPPVADKEG